MESEDAPRKPIGWLPYAGLLLLLMFLRDADRTRLLLHSVGIAMILAGFPFMKTLHVRHLQFTVLCTLVADIVFRNAFAPPPLRHSGITPAWIALAAGYCLLVVFFFWFELSDSASPSRRRGSPP